MSNTNNSAIIPVPKLETDFYDWYQRHEEKKSVVNSRQFDLIFIGDSITHFFEGHPGIDDKGDKVWRQFYGDRNALNLGFGWDRIQNVLWRLQNGEFENQFPQLVVLNIGTNNLSATVNARENTVEEILEGIKIICEFIFFRSSKTHILLMGIFPRDIPTEHFRHKIYAINQGLQLFAGSREQIMFIDIGDKFMDAAGNIDMALMPDLVHPTANCYQIWAESIEDILRKYKFRKV